MENINNNTNSELIVAYVTRLSLLLLFFCICSCNKKQEAMQSIHIPDMKENDSIKKIIKKVEILPLEQNESCYVSYIGKCLIKNNKIYVLDNHEDGLFVFNLNGKFVRRVGVKGRGPGEFLACDDFIIDKDGLVVLDNMSQKLIYYTLSGEFLKDQKYFEGGAPVFLANRMEKLKNGNYVFTGATRPPKCNYLFVADNKFQLKKAGFTQPIINRQNALIKHGDKVYFHTFANDTIYEIDGSNQFIPHLFINFGKKSFRNADPKQYTTRGKYKRYSAPEGYRNLENYLECDKYILMRFLEKESGKFIAQYVLINKQTNKLSIFSSEDFRSLVKDARIVALNSFDENNKLLVVGYPANKGALVSGNNPILAKIEFK